MESRAKPCLERLSMACDTPSAGYRQRRSSLVGRGTCPSFLADAWKFTPNPLRGLLERFSTVRCFMSVKTALIGHEVVSRRDADER
jgi:hypothetical protein